MEDNRILKMITFGEASKGKRKRGRPKKNWRESVKEDIKLFGITFQQLQTSEDEHIKQKNSEKRTLNHNRRPFKIIII